MVRILKFIGKILLSLLILFIFFAVLRIILPTRMELGGCPNCPIFVFCDCWHYYLYKIHISATLWATIQIGQIVLSVVITSIISIKLFRRKKVETPHNEK